jgi:hypothetical protein
MLKYHDGRVFTSSLTKYLDNIANRAETRIWILVRFDELPKDFAVVDTGAPYCVLSREQASLIHPGYRTSATEPITMTVRGHRNLPGVLIRLPVTVCAEEGDDITIDGTVFVPDEDAGLPNFVGYRGLLERINFAVDPREKFFLFGQS